MPRPRRMRRIWQEPEIKRFKPLGKPLSELEAVTMKTEELEAIRLSDFLGLSQNESAERMNVSQPTFHRLILSARKKVADMIVNGKSLTVSGGDFLMASEQNTDSRLRQPPIQCGCACGYLEPKIRGAPCANRKCPKCGKRMNRKQPTAVQKK